MPILPNGVEQFDIDGIDFNVLKKSLVVHAGRGRHEVVAQLNIHGFQRACHSTGAAPVHAEDDNDGFFVRIHDQVTGTHRLSKSIPPSALDVPGMEISSSATDAPAKSCVSFLAQSGWGARNRAISALPQHLGNRFLWEIDPYTDFPNIDNSGMGGGKQST
jgi:hypothetical protein